MLFRNNYWFLSNFYECEITITIGDSTYTFNNAEAAFHAHKNYACAGQFVGLSGSAAKKLGKQVELATPDWDTNRLYVMARVLHVKFSNPTLLVWLKNIKEDIYEDNYWHEVYWGRDLNTSKGQNWLGRLLMCIRDTDNNLLKLIQYIDENKE